MPRRAAYAAGDAERGGSSALSARAHATLARAGGLWLQFGPRTVDVLRAESRRLAAATACALRGAQADTENPPKSIQALQDDCFLVWSLPLGRAPDARAPPTAVRRPSSDDRTGTARRRRNGQNALTFLFLCLHLSPAHKVRQWKQRTFGLPPPLVTVLHVVAECGLDRQCGARRDR